MPREPLTVSKSQLRYIQVEETLHSLLETGGYRSGDQLPPEPELAQQLGVSRATLREALRSFEQQGIISRRQGVGTFVNPRPIYIENGLESLESIEMLLQSRQIVPQVQNRDVRTEKALPKAARRLAVPESTPLTVISTTYAVAGEGIAYLLEVAPADLVTQDQLIQSSTSLLDHLLSHQERFDLRYAVAHITPVHGSQEICRALSVDSRTPLFFIEQTVFNSRNEPICYSRNYYVPSLFDFHLIRKVGAR